jgi:hypothetical protein
MKWAVAELDEMLGTTFGGYTATDATGGWRNPASGLVEQEPVRVYTISFANHAMFDERALNVVIDWIKKRFAQQAVLVECVDCIRYISE